MGQAKSHTDLRPLRRNACDKFSQLLRHGCDVELHLTVDSKPPDLLAVNEHNNNLTANQFGPTGSAWMVNRRTCPKT
jgi:hypothetical protein